MVIMCMSTKFDATMPALVLLMFGEVQALYSCSASSFMEIAVIKQELDMGSGWTL